VCADAVTQQQVTEHGKAHSVRRWVRRMDALDATFAVLGAILVVFVMLPLASTLVGTSPRELLLTLTDREVLGALWLTLVAATIATLFALVTGVPLSYVLARYEFRGKRLVEGLVDLPLVIPHTAAGVALIMVFGRRAVFGRLGAAVGLHFTGSIAGIVVAMLFVSLPLLVNGAREAFAMVDPELERVALTLGADRWQAFRLVTLPLAWRGVLAGALTMWARGLSEFGAVVILAYNPKIIPVVVYERFAGFGLAAARPVALLLILAALSVFLILRGLTQPREF
jgi:molybdate/tungstate transport system permease protein